uniref:Glycine-rich protein n=1 Tax=Globodera pallida TaxID=36090 RepID=A0A183BRR7_GLOPA
MNFFLLCLLLFPITSSLAGEEQAYGNNGGYHSPSGAYSSHSGAYSAPSGAYSSASSEKSGDYEYAHGSGVRLVDDYICDLDASILIVTNSEKELKGNSGYGGGKTEYGGVGYSDDTKEYGGKDS